MSEVQSIPTIQHGIAQLTVLFFFRLIVRAKNSKMSMVILSNVNTKEVMERWNFKFQCKGSGDSNTDSVGNKKLSIFNHAKIN